MKLKRANYFLCMFSAFTLFLAVFTSCRNGSNQQVKVDAVVTIDKSIKPKPYNPMIFGGFLEHFNKQVYGGIYDPESPLSDDNGFRTDVISALKELKAPVLRWPGGCYIDAYDWKDGVGDNRQIKDDLVWGVRDPHTFGTDEYIEFCRIMGWEPYICNNGNSTLEEMESWLEYCNQTEGKYADMRKANGHIKPMNVKFWSVGNENYHPSFASKVLKAAKAMKQIDPDVKVTCPALPDDPKTGVLLKTAGEYLDYISIHWYWIGNYHDFKRPDYLTCMMESQGPESFITRTINTIEQAGYRGKIKISFDEWNLRSWHHPGFPHYCCMKGKTHQCPTHKVINYDDPNNIRLVKARDKSMDNSLYTMADALFAASFFNACLRHADDVKMANIAPIVNQTGPLFVHPEGIVRRPHFHTMAMYANMLEGYVGTFNIQSDSISNGGQSVPVVDAVATSDEAGKKWVISLINRDPHNTKACKVKLGDYLLNGEFDVTILSGDSPDAYNDIEYPAHVMPEKKTFTFCGGIVNLPPHSLTIFSVD